MKNNSALAAMLQSLWADNFVVYFMVHSMHFNTQGPNFEGDHEFFQEVYEFLFEQHDTIGEQIRQLDKPVLVSLASVLSASSIEELEPKMIDAKTMYTELSSYLDDLTDIAQRVYEMAGSTGCGGVETMIGDYLKMLGKLNWKAKASIGRSIR